MNVKLLISALLLFCALHLKAQTSKDAAVTVQCIADSSTNKVKLSWLFNDAATGYQVFRKLKGSTNWGASIANLPSTATEYLDNNSNTGLSYEYQIIRNAPVVGAGYINAGLKVKSVLSRGKMILLVEKSVEEALTSEIKTLTADLEGDGWEVIYATATKDLTPKSVKDQIKALYNQDKANTKALYILGHIPVPYSGSIAPDGHPDHQGAWPADGYYGEMDGNWTDTQISTEVAGDSRNRNIVGDGKFDQSLFPSSIELQVGRVDFHNMPVAVISEIELLRKYLNKAHDYKHKKIQVNPIAIVDDNFGYFSGEAFGASAWRTLGGLVGKDSIKEGDYIESMKNKNYQWSYGCGGGSYQSAGGIGSTQNVIDGNANGIFTMLFGSYFGDWDTQNNFLRGALVSGNILTNVWAGRPAWYFHHMGLGENIGYSTRANQNNDNAQYRSHYGTKFIHMALMGDPSLRQHIVAPLQGVTASQEVANIKIAWSTASLNPSVSSYQVFVKRPGQSSFVFLGKSDNNSLTYIDSCQLILGQHVYMIKVEELTVCPSGSYYNTSIGMFDTISITSIPLEPKASAVITLEKNLLRCLNSTTNSTTYFWQFGDGNTSMEKDPVHVYDSLGTYTITLIVSDGCRSDTLVRVVNVLTGTYDDLTSNGWSVFPNPVYNVLHLLNSERYKVEEVEILTATGESTNCMVDNGKIDVSHLLPGVYIARIKLANGTTQLKKFVKL